MRSTLLVSWLPTHFVELLRVARLLKATGRWTVGFCFAQPYHELRANIAACREQGFEVHVVPDVARALAGGTDFAPPAAPVPSRLARSLRWLPARVKDLLRSLRASADRVRRFQISLRHHRAKLAQARSVLDAAHPSLLVLAEDNPGYVTAAFVRTGHERGIRTLIVPYTVADATEPAEAYWHQPDFQLARIENRAVAWLHPRWVFEHRGRKLLRLTGPDAFALERLGLAPPLPWIMNSGAADAIAVESEAMRDHYLRCGLPEPQLVTTGSLADDIVAAALGEAPARRAELLRELGLPGGRPLVLCAIPSDLVYLREGACEFGSWRDLALFWVRTVVARLPGWNVVINLHPCHRGEAASWLEAGGARVARHDIATLVPLCDLYVASVSATIRLAIGAGKPVLNYDVYRFRYPDYRGEPAVLTVEDRVAFEGLLDSLARKPGRLSELAATQRSRSACWAKLDGKAGERMLSLVDRLAAAPPP